MGLLPDDIEEKLRAEVERRGLILLDLVQRGQRNSKVLEVVIDSEQGVGLDELTELSRWIGGLFDEHEEAIPGRYRLEVSSGGLDRPLQFDWQYRKNIGRLIKLSFKDGDGVGRTEIYRLVGIDADHISVEPRKTKGSAPAAPATIPLERITRATIEPEI